MALPKEIRMAAALANSPAAPPRRAEEPLHEIVRGVRVELPPMGAEAVDAATELSAGLRPFAKQARLGRVVQEALFVIDRAQNTRRRPDVAFVSAERWPLERPLPTGDWDVVPDLAVEVVSPNDALYAVLEKIDEYFAAGVREVWVLTPPRREATVYTLDRNPRVVTAAESLETPLLPGFAVKVGELFQPVG